MHSIWNELYQMVHSLFHKYQLKIEIWFVYLILTVCQKHSWQWQLSVNGTGKQVSSLFSAFAISSVTTSEHPPCVTVVAFSSFLLLCIVLLLRFLILFLFFFSYSSPSLPLPLVLAVPTCIKHWYVYAYHYFSSVTTNQYR